MEKYLDEICIFAFCCIAMMLQGYDEVFIVGLLLAIVVTCARYALPHALSLALSIAFVGAACVSGSLLFFLPVVAYALMHEGSWPPRLAWVVPPILNAALGTASATACATAGVVCLIASLMAVADIRRETERLGMLDTCDSLREFNLALENRALKPERSSGQDGEGSPENVGGETSGEERLPAHPFADLTKREAAVAMLVAQGKDNREIATELFLSEGTVRNHISSILAKKNLHNRTQIAVLYYTKAAS